ncbi:MAG TPA: hypothetical protein VF006_08745 [Longimicrobium sp.]
MPHLRKTTLLLAAALCAAAGELAAQPGQRLDADAARRLREQGVTLRVGADRVDTMRARTGTLRVGEGEMIVNVTGARPTRVRPQLAPRADPTPPPIVQPPAALHPGDEPAARPDPRPGRTRPPGTEPAPERPKREEPPPPQVQTQAPPQGPPSAAGLELPDPATPIAYQLGYQIGIGDQAGEDFHIVVPIVEIEGGGLRYDAAQQAYVGTILFGLVDRDHPSASVVLTTSVMLQVTGDVQSMAPVQLRRINIPFEQITLRVHRPRADSVLVRIRPTFDPTGGSVISVPILRAPLTLQASPRRIAGFGLEISELAVQALRRGDTLPVVISSTRAKPNPALLRATHDGAMSRVRSAGVGVDTVRVASGDFEEMVVIRFAWPISFLLAALFGGLVGGVLNALSTRRRSSRRIIAFLGAQGALTGAVGAVLYAVGINVVGWAPSAEYGEGLMFAVAFASGLMGPRIFDRFLPRLSVGRKDGGDPPPTAPPSSPAAPSTPQPAAVG